MCTDVRKVIFMLAAMIKHSKLKFEWIVDLFKNGLMKIFSEVSAIKLNNSPNADSPIISNDIADKY